MKKSTARGQVNQTRVVESDRKTKLQTTLSKKLYFASLLTRLYIQSPSV